MHNVHSSGWVCWAIYQATKYDLFLLYDPFNTHKKILALLLPAPQESHLNYNHTTHRIKPLVKKWSPLHLDLETFKTTLSYPPKNIKRRIFVCFSGMVTSSYERINVAGLHFMCSLFPNSLAYHHAYGYKIRRRKKVFLNCLFFSLYAPKWKYFTIKY